VTGRDRPRAPTTAPSYFDSMFGGARARTPRHRRAENLIGIGFPPLVVRGQGVSSALAPNVSEINFCAGEIETQTA